VGVKPKIFIPNESWNELIEVLLEQYENFDIYWYHWPHDGWIGYFIPDYEPVIIIYKGDSICYIITRPHWTYEPHGLEEITIPIEVLFDGSSHPPYPRTYDSVEWFHRKTSRLVLQTYDIRKVKADEIPEMFRTGEDHPTSLGKRVEDPVEFAKEIYEQNCKD